MAKGKILVVDDSPTQLNMMRAPFERSEEHTSELQSH